MNYTIESAVRKATVRIEIKGARLAPSWEVVDKLLRTMLDPGAPVDGSKHDATAEDRRSFGYGQLTRISRDDHKHNYRGFGEYTLTFTSDRDGDTIVHLIVA